MNEVTTPASNALAMPASQENKAPIEELPRGAWQRICGNLPVSDLCNLSRVSRTCHLESTHDDTWSTRYWERFGELPLVPTAAKYQYASRARQVAEARLFHGLRMMPLNAPKASIDGVRRSFAEIRAFIERGGNPNARSLAMQMPLFSAWALRNINSRDRGSLISGLLKQEFVQTARILLSHGADLKGMDARGNTILHHVADKSYLAEWVLHLIDAGPNLPNEAGDTPLHIAVRGGVLEIARVLLNHGARLMQRNRAGETPFSLGVSSNYAGIAQWVREQAQRPEDEGGRAAKRARQ